MVTLNDIAKKTALSLSVVSRALNPNPDQQVSPEAKAKVEEAVRKLNYKRNNTASFMARGKNATIGVFLPNYAYSLVADLSIGLSNEAMRRGFPCNFYYGLHERDYMDFLASVKSNGNSGIISYLPQLEEKTFSEVLADYRKTGGKVLLINSPGIPEHGMASVCIDNQYGGELAGKHLYERDCREFFCLLTKNSWQSSERCVGFVDFCKSKKISVHVKYVEVESFQHFKPFKLKEALKPYKRKQVGIFATSDFIALNAIRELTINGYQQMLGNQIKIIGYDNLPTTQYSVPSLTSVNQSFSQLGSYGMARLIHMINGINEKLPELPQPQLVIRESA